MSSFSSINSCQIIVFIYYVWLQVWNGPGDHGRKKRGSDVVTAHLFCSISTFGPSLCSLSLHSWLHSCPLSDKCKGRHKFLFWIQLCWFVASKLILWQAVKTLESCRSTSSSPLRANSWRTQTDRNNACGTKIKRIFAGLLTEEQRDGISSKLAPHTSHID